MAILSAEIRMTQITKQEADKPQTAPKMVPFQAQPHQQTALSTHDHANMSHVASDNNPLDQSLTTKLHAFDGSTAFRFPSSCQVPHTTSACLASSASTPTQPNGCPDVSFLVQTPGGRTAHASVCPTASYDLFVNTLLESAVRRDSLTSGADMMSLPSSFTQKRSHEEECRQHHAQGQQDAMSERRVRRRVGGFEAAVPCSSQRRAESASRVAFITHKGRILDREKYRALLLSSKGRSSRSTEIDVSIRLRLIGGSKECGMW